MQSFEAQCRARDLLDKTVVLFDDFVQIFHAQDIYCLEHPREFQPNIYA